MQYIIDRIEGNLAVCQEDETGTMIHIPVKALPFGCGEGDHLEEKNGEYIFNSQATEDGNRQVQEKRQGMEMPK